MKKIIPLILFLIILNFSGCSSKGYEIEQEKVESTKSIKVDLPSSRPDTIEIKEEPLPYSKERNVLYTIQLAAFTNEDNAVQFLSIARNKISFDISYYLKEGLYKVFSGTFSTKQDALINLDLIRNSGFNDAFIVLK